MQFISISFVIGQGMGEGCWVWDANPDILTYSEDTHG